jgi:hypothetical protein
MTSRTWILRTFAAIAFVLCLNFAAAVLMDPYGIFRDPRGRRLHIVFAARKAKFLLSKRYVPTNYDALLIGPSSSENWDPVLPGVTLYNESTLGSNVTEEKRIVDQALPLGHFKLAICIVYPTMTDNHAINDGLDAVTTAEALGSIHLYIHEAAQILAAMHRPFSNASEADGATPLKVLAQKFDAKEISADYFQLDPAAVADYTHMVQSLQSNGARIVYVIPALYEPCRLPNAASFEAYRESMQQILPQAPTIDLSGPDFEAFRTNPDNYIDCFHVSAEGAAKINAYLTQHIH